MLGGIIIGLMFAIIIILILGLAKLVGDIDDRLKEIERKSNYKTDLK